MEELRFYSHEMAAGQSVCGFSKEILKTAFSL
jgi:hypothetical protein